MTDESTKPPVATGEADGATPPSIEVLSDDKELIGTVADDTAPPPKTRASEVERERSRVEYVQRSITFSSGPLPPAEELQAYENVFPGCAKKIVDMADSQREHRQRIEAKVVDTHSTTEIWGQRFGFGVAVIGMLGGIFLVSAGHSKEGLLLMGADLATLVGLFVYGKREQGSELAKKAGPMNQAGHPGPPASPSKKKKKR